MQRKKFIRYSSILSFHKRFFSTETQLYDLLVIGSGPSATQCAIDSAKRGKKVALVDRQEMTGGMCVHKGTIPSKTFREAVLYLTGYRHTGFYGKSYSVHRKVTIPDILQRVNQVITNEVDTLKAKLKSNYIDLIPGNASFQSPNEVLISHPDKEDRLLGASKFLIACGTRPSKSSDFPCDGKLILNSDQMVSRKVNKIPKSLIVVGAGIVGMEYASMIAVLPGTDVTIIDARPEVLTFADREMVSNLMHQMRGHGTRFLFGERVTKVNRLGDSIVHVELNSGKTVVGDCLLYTVGRQANIEGLNLTEIGINTSDRGMIQVNEFYQTNHDHIYAAGDCIGPPSLASTSLEQGRLASCDMWGSRTQDGCVGSQLSTGNYPISVYSIPEMSMVGKSEQDLISECRNYEVGVAKFEELAKGCMMGGRHEGVLKILFDPTTLEILGVHAFGDGATEIIHIGQVAKAMGCTIKYFRDAVFNYPTLAEAYRVAALNGLGRL